MKCSDVSAELDRFVDGSIESESAKAVDAHLHDCAHCRDAVALARNVATVLGAEGPAPLPVGLSERAFNMAMSHPVDEPSWLDELFPFAWRGALAAVVVAALLGPWAAVTRGGSTDPLNALDATSLVEAQMRLAGVGSDAAEDG